MRLLTLLLALCALLVFADATRLTTRVQAYRNCPAWCYKSGVCFHDYYYLPSCR